MFLKPLSPAARFLVCFGLAAPSILVSVACVLTFQDQRRMDTAFGWVRHALQVENRVHQLVLDVHEFETGERGYIYTGRTIPLDSFRAGEARIPLDLAALRQDTADDPEQQQRLLELEALILDRLDLARQGVELQRTGRHDAALKLVRSDRGKSAMDGIHTIAEEMRQHEALLLTSRDRALARSRKGHARWFYGLLCLNLSSLACTFLLLHRLGKAESLARVCAWSKRIEHEGQWLSFEEYLNRRFSIDTTHTISPSEIDRLITEISADPPASPVTVAPKMTSDSPAAARPPTLAR